MNCYLSKPAQWDAFATLVKSVIDFWLTKVKLPNKQTRSISLVFDLRYQGKAESLSRMLLGFLVSGYPGVANAGELAHASIWRRRSRLMSCTILGDLAGYGACRYLEKRQQTAALRIATSEATRICIPKQWPEPLALVRFCNE